MKKLLFALTLVSGLALGHEGTPQSANPEEDRAIMYCMTHSARAAWGAKARFFGAPAKFIYVPMEKVKAMMLGQTEILNDGIYIAEELTLDQRKDYEVSAFFGWKQADQWVQKNLKPLDSHELTAKFYQHCREQTKNVK